MEFQTADWVAIAGAALASILSIFGLYYSRAALRLAKSQDERRKPKLSVEYQDGHISLPADGEPPTYMFLVKLVNRSEADSSVMDAILEVTYKLGDDVPVTASVRHDSLSATVPNSAHAILALPVRIDGHQAVFGWGCFPLSAALAVRQPDFLSYAVKVTDTANNSTSFQPLLLAVRA